MQGHSQWKTHLQPILASKAPVMWWMSHRALKTPLEWILLLLESGKDSSGPKSLIQLAIKLDFVAV